MNVPIGILTPTNSPLCKAGPTESTVFPNAIPMAMARMIHTTRKRSRNDRPFRGGRSFWVDGWPIISSAPPSSPAFSTSHVSPFSPSLNLLCASFSFSACIGPRSTVSIFSIFFSLFPLFCTFAAKSIFAGLRIIVVETRRDVG